MNKAFEWGWLQRYIAAAGMGILLIAVAPAGQAAETARHSNNGGEITSSIPTILDESDIARYRQIFQLQENGNWKKADALIKSLGDDVLMGHVLYQRYMHPTKYRSKYKELKDWMAAYADHPSAGAIYKLAQRRRPKNWKRPNPPRKLADAGVLQRPKAATRIRIPGKRLSTANRRKARATLHRIKRALKRGHTLTAKRIMQEKQTKRLLSDAQFDEARTLLAKGYFIDGRDKWALDWALPALKRSGKYLPEGHWTAGLLLWRQEKYGDAADHFRRAAENERVSQWLGSASAFWAARSYAVARKPERVLDLLERAAQQPRTFYGLLATRLLGRDLPFNWTPPAIDGEQLVRLKDSPRGRRAIALMQVGDDRRAEGELKNLARGADADLLKGVHALAARGNMASLAVRLDVALYPDGGGYDGALYPIPGYIPKEGFSVDRALVYALIRQESRFNPKAKSWAGARGLMQLMPGTARFVARSTGMRLKSRNKLYTPETNLELGQRYIEMLLDEKDISHNLFKLAVAWNGGPGNLRKWKRRTKYLNDPIFFIESIPSYETRTFVEKVLTNFWIYRDRLGQESPSLDAVARGEWPFYTAMGPGDIELARTPAN